MRRNVNRSIAAGRLFTAAAALVMGTALAVMAGCATSSAGGPTVQMLSQQHYPPTQTVDVLSAPPAQAYEKLAQLQLADPTGTATSSQLVAQLADAAKQLGANALVVQGVSRDGAASVSFNPSGGMMQDAAATGPISVSALAIRYTP